MTEESATAPDNTVEADENAGPGITAIRAAYTNSSPLSDDIAEEIGAAEDRIRAAMDAATIKGEPLADDPATGSHAARPPNDHDYNVEAINQEFSLVIMGSRALVIKERSTGPIADRKQIITPEAFLTWFGNRFTELRAADGKVKTVTWGRAWLNDRGRRSYEGVEFYPDPENRPGTPAYLNLWRGFSVTPTPKPNGYKVFRDHLLNNICDGKEDLFAWVFAFFAHIIQRPRERIGVALVLRGKQGSGKTVIGEHFGSLLGSARSAITPRKAYTGALSALCCRRKARRASDGSPATRRRGCFGFAGARARRKRASRPPSARCGTWPGSFCSASTPAAGRARFWPPHGCPALAARL